VTPTQTETRADSAWNAAVDEHRIALAQLVDAAERVPATSWTTPRAPGKWSPGQVVEHLALTYEVLLRELRDGEGMRVRMPGWRSSVLRWIVLPHVLFHRKIPPGVRAPREIRPADEAPPVDATLRRLRLRAEEFEDELDRARRAGGGQLTHPFFGRVGPVKALRFCAVHAEHHGRQLPAR
jgi:hypothetical protein